MLVAAVPGAVPPGGPGGTGAGPRRTDAVTCRGSGAFHPAEGRRQGDGVVRGAPLGRHIVVRAGCGEDGRSAGPGARRGATSAQGAHRSAGPAARQFRPTADRVGPAGRTARDRRRTQTRKQTQAQARTQAPTQRTCQAHATHTHASTADDRGLPASRPADRREEESPVTTTRPPQAAPAETVVGAPRPTARPDHTQAGPQRAAAPAVHSPRPPTTRWSASTRPR